VFRNRRLFSVCLILFCLITAAVSLVGAEPEEPSLELTDRQGDLEVEREGLTSVENPEELEAGDALRTDNGENVKLRFSDDMLVEVTENTEVTIQSVEKKTEERGFLFTEQVTVSELNIRLNEGRLLNTIQSDDEGEEFDVTVNTPMAVAGVRGTAYDISVGEDDVTSVGVLEGEVNLRPQAAPDQQITLGGNQQSTVTQPDLEPTEPQPLTDAREQRLQQHRQFAAAELSPQPVIPELQIEGGALTDGRMVQLATPRPLELSGQVEFPGQTEADSVQLQVGDQSVPVQGNTNWSAEFEAQPPSIGETTAVSVELTATNNFGASTSRAVSLQLENPQPDGDLPWEYSLGSLDPSINQFARREFTGIQFPYHVYENDLNNGDILLTVAGNDDLAGIAYSTNPTVSWQSSEDGSPLQLRIDPAEFRDGAPLWIRGWTDDGTLGYPQRVGTVRYQPIRVSTLGRRMVRRKWEQFQRENERGVMAFLAEDAYVEVRDGDVTFSRDQYEYEFLEPRFRDWRSLNVTQDIQRTTVTPDGGRIRSQLNITGITSDRLEFLTAATVDHELRRQPNGLYRFDLLRFENSGVYKYTESVTLNHLEGLSLSSVKGLGTTPDCGQPRKFDVCVDLVATGGGGSISGDNGIAANPQTTGSSASHIMEYTVDAGSNLVGESLNDIDLIYGAGSNPSDVSSINSSADISVLELNGSDISGDIDTVSNSDGGTTLNINLFGNNDLFDTSVIRLETASSVVNPSSAGNYDVEVPINGKETKTFQLEIIEDATNKKLIPSSQRRTSIKRLSGSDPFQVDRLPPASGFTDTSQTLNSSDLFAVRTEYRGEERTALLDFQTVTSGTNGSASVRLIIGETLVGDVGVEEFPTFNIYRRTGTP
jgi:hypothetical protein